MSDAANNNSGREPIRIVYHISRLSVGGTENQLYELATKLDRDSFEPVVWCSGPWGPVGVALENAGITLRRFSLEPWRPDSIWRVVQWLAKLKPAIFHSLDYGAHWLDLLLARLAGVPIRLTVRQNIRHWDPHGRAGLRENIRNRLTHRVIANSQAAADVCATVEDVPPMRIQVIYGGVELPTASAASARLRQELEIPADAFLIGNVANLRPMKGHEDLLHAFQAVMREVSRAHLIICGEGEYRARLEDLRDKLGLTRSVSLPGLRHDMESVYRSLDLYVHPSHSESFSCSVLEAMAYGLAVVGTRVGGIPEAIEEKITGVLVPPAKPAELAAAVVALIRDEQRRERLGQAARRTVGSRFTLQNMVQQHELLYRTLIAEHGLHQTGNIP